MSPLWSQVSIVPIPLFQDHQHFTTHTCINDSSNCKVLDLDLVQSFWICHLVDGLVEVLRPILIDLVFQVHPEC